MDISEDDSRENYSKVVLHKQLWIPLAKTTMTMQEPPSPSLTTWRTRQEAERERIRKLDHTPVPPQRPPKKAHLRQTSKLLRSSAETLGLTAGSLAEKRKLFSLGHSVKSAPSISDEIVRCPTEKGDYAGEGNPPTTSTSSLHITIGDSARQILGSKHAKKRPPVPPKPVFEKQTGRYKSAKSLSETLDQYDSCNKLSESCQNEGAHENKAKDVEDNFNNNAENKENLKRRTLVRSNYWQEQAKEVVDQDDDDDIEIFEKTKYEIEVEIDKNNVTVEDIIKIVGEDGSMSDVDKLKVHVKEVETVTNLLIVLTERLGRIKEELKGLDENEEREPLLVKKQKLLDQLEDANKLKIFRDRRGKAIFDSLRLVVDTDILNKFQHCLENKVKLISLLRKSDSKINKQLISQKE